ncbi:MAG: hypothetical protein P8N63_00735 [Pseudomonadales bacterium]|nr:hypothetical protein [Pseudomonadales bacterium]
MNGNKVERVYSPNLDEMLQAELHLTVSEGDHHAIQLKSTT